MASEYTENIDRPIIKKMSALMSFSHGIGAKRLAWKLRRLYCPVKKDDLVLEVGSGGNPYFRANVLCDAYVETAHRHFEPLVADRITVIAEGEKLPFKDNAFDFVIASHVLEHSRDPKQFISELQRVAGAGYIETPDALMERVCPYPIHSLEVSDRGGKLVIKKKKGSIEDGELFSFFSAGAYKTFTKWVTADPFLFHVRYYWNKEEGGINYEILNPEYKFDWSFVEPEIRGGKDGGLRVAVIKILRRFLSQTTRNKHIGAEALLKCKKCEGSVSVIPNGYRCNACGIEYETKEGNIINTIV